MNRKERRAAARIQARAIKKASKTNNPEGTMRVIRLTNDGASVSDMPCSNLAEFLEAMRPAGL